MNRLRSCGRGCVLPDTIIFLRENINRFADDFKDAGTGDFITGLMEEHEKMAWDAARASRVNVELRSLDQIGEAGRGDLNSHAKDQIGAQTVHNLFAARPQPP